MTKVACAYCHQVFENLTDAGVHLITVCASAPDVYVWGEEE